jgi:hypothetical protein
MANFTRQDAENGDVTYLLQATFPDDAPEIFTLAAEADGWRAKITDANGVEINNPESPAERVLVMAIRQVLNSALQVYARKEADVAQMAAIARFQGIQQKWQSFANEG